MNKKGLKHVFFSKSLVIPGPTFLTSGKRTCVLSKYFKEIRNNVCN